MMKRRLLIAVYAATAYVRAAPAESASFGAPRCGALLPTNVNTGEPPTTDMVLAPDGIPHGTVDNNGNQISWASRPRVWRGNKPRSGWSSIVATGMIYISRDGKSRPGVRVEVRDLDLFVRPNATGRWCLLDSVAIPDGARFLENFAGNAAIEKSSRVEQDGGESVEIVPGRNFHFWGRRLLIPVSGVSGIFVQFQARVITNGTPVAAKMPPATYLGAASGDFWKSQTAIAGHVGDLNEDIAIGRFMSLSPNWRTITMNSNGGPALAPQQ